MKVVICDDHAIFRTGLIAVLQGLPGEIELAQTDNAAAALALIEAGDVNLVLMDLEMPKVDGFQALRQIREEHPTVAVVIVSASEETADIRSALKAGAVGFIPKSSSEPLLRAALEVVFSSGAWGIDSYRVIGWPRFRLTSLAAGRRVCRKMEVGRRQ